MLFIIGMIGISSCTEQDLSTLKSPDAQVELRVADPPCYDAPYVPGFITITNRYLNAQGQCCITIQCNPPLTGSPGATYSACLSNTQSGAPLHPNLCVFFSAAGGTQTICYALTNFPLKITVTDESTGKIVNCDTYGKTCD